ncbi:hypothetical protein QQX98_001432 [Neonectria punicea]|uniref:Xylanolytic transcriptional activator regulatory domain-containing protein n=1 Tax=Neonectria punicea TaxID=979145 RepID=A0ABR1HPB1_9HYPO
MWVGLLFGIMCLAAQFQQYFLPPSNHEPDDRRSSPASQAPENQVSVEIFREKIIQCLNLGHYTRGGPFVLETIILYLVVEIFPLKDIEIGVWVLVGNTVQIATHMGYHRDGAHFTNITPFAGEMRRRVWAMVVQLDFGISTQLGLPRLIKESRTTAEPRNLIDSDFDEGITELPPSRPESEITPTLYTISKLRILSVGAKVADIATEPRPYSYDKILELDKEIDRAQEALPSSMKWKSLSLSLAVPPMVTTQRMWLEICVQRLKLVLHKKFLVPSGSKGQYAYSKSACLAGAMRILEFQHLVDEETHVDGRLYHVRWRVTTALTHEFLLATSVLCFYLQVYSKSQADSHESPGDADAASLEKVRQLLKTSQEIWKKLSANSTEARKAVAALQYVLGGSSGTSESSESAEMVPNTASTMPFPYFPACVMNFEFISPGATPLPTGVPRLSEKAVFGKKNCANCGKSGSALWCDDCEVTDVGQLRVFYCSEACKTAHKPAHKATCDARKALTHAVSVFGEIWTAFESSTFGSTAKLFHERSGTIITFQDDSQPDPRGWTGASLFRKFPDDVLPDTASEATQRAFLFDSNCNEPLIAGAPLQEVLLKPVCETIQVGKVEMKNPAMVIRLVGCPYIPQHTVFKITQSTGEVFAVDFTGGQFGFQEQLYEWKTYIKYRAEPGSKTITLAQMAEEENAHYRAANMKADSCGMATKILRTKLMRGLRGSIDAHLASEKTTAKDIMFLQHSEFGPAREKLITEAKVGLQKALDFLALKGISRVYFAQGFNPRVALTEECARKYKDVWLTDDEMKAMKEDIGALMTTWTRRMQRAG